MSIASCSETVSYGLECEKKKGSGLVLLTSHNVIQIGDLQWKIEERMCINILSIAMSFQFRSQVDFYKEAQISAGKVM
jgi:hypothetical protein